MFSYFLERSYKDNCDLQSQTGLIDENVVALCNLMKKFKTNLAESQKQQTLYHNKHIKKRLYQPEESI